MRRESFVLVSSNGNTHSGNGYVITKVQTDLQFNLVNGSAIPLVMHNVTRAVLIHEEMALSMC